MDLTLRTALSLIVCTLLLGLGSGAHAAGGGSFVVLYDVDFASPPHTLGMAPATGSGPIPRDTPTGIQRNPVVVQSTYAGLTDQPMAFPGPGRGDVVFSLAGLPLCPDYRLEMDVVVDFDLRIILSTPFTNLVQFNQNGDVVLTIRDMATGTQTQTVVAMYNPGDGAVHNMVVSFDLQADTFEMQLDGLIVHSSTFGGQADFTQFRVLGNAAAIDNLVLDSGQQVTEIAAKVDIWPFRKSAPVINLRRRSLLPVVLFGTEELDVADVDRSSLKLSDTDGDSEDGVAPRWILRFDVDCDGMKDLVLIFFTHKLKKAGVVTLETTSLTLSGQTAGGTALSGSHDVKVISKKRVRRRRCRRR